MTTRRLGGGDLRTAAPVSPCQLRFTDFLRNGDTIEAPQKTADHGSPRTTKLYVRTNDEVDESERILI